MFIPRYIVIFAELPDLYWLAELAGFHDSQCLCLPLSRFTAPCSSTRAYVWLAIATIVQQQSFSEFGHRLSMSTMTVKVYLDFVSQYEKCAELLIIDVFQGC